MLKKILVASFILLASAHSAFALNELTDGSIRYQNQANNPPPYNYKGEPPAYYKGEAPPPPPPEQPIPCKTYTFSPGFYFGLAPAIRTNYSTQATAVYKAFEGTLFGGYAFIYSSYYLGAEIFAQTGAQLQNYTNLTNNNGNAVGFKTTYGGGLSLIPGFFIADSLFGFLRLGSITTHFHDVARTKTGGQIGIGLDGAVTERWDVRVEYDYSFFPTLPILGTARSDQYHVGFVYRVDP